jgi:hypothetical protein
VTVVAIRLVRARSAPAKGDPGLFSDQSSVPVHEPNPASHIERAEVACSDGRDLVGLFLREVALRLVLQRARRTPADGRSDLICIRGPDIDPRTSGDIEDFGKGGKTFGNVRAPGRVPNDA